jgi:hypothetical protein
MHRKASAIAVSPGGLGRNHFGATVIDGSVYAVIAAGATYAVGDDINARIVYGLPLTGSDVDLTNSSWDAICGALDCFPEAGTLGGLFAGADLDALLAAKVSIVKADSGIGVMFRRSNLEMPFTVVGAGLTNIGESNRAADFGGMPFAADEGFDYNGAPDSQTKSAITSSPNIEYSVDAQELIFARCFKDGSFPSTAPASGISAFGATPSRQSTTA